MNTPTERLTPETSKLLRGTAVSFNFSATEMLAHVKQLERQRDELLDFVTHLAEVDINGACDSAVRYMFTAFQGNAKQAITNVKKGEPKQ